MNLIIKPTEAELEILQVLWQKQQATVREINDELNLAREIGYTTTLKLMQIMLDKGLVSRIEETRSHIYMAAVSENETQNLLLDKFVANTFRGSAMKLVMQALGNHEASKEELAELKQMIADLENDITSVRLKKADFQLIR
jgi:BlaI family transcriptional regulator, penicillinase repressor